MDYIQQNVAHWNISTRYLIFSINKNVKFDTMNFGEN